MKPKYEKPVAMPLGEAAKGSGQCNAGSGVPMVGEGSCYKGEGGTGQCTLGSIVKI
jgi:hypothetical protein